MEILELIQFLIGGIFLLIGTAIFLIETYGVFRYKYALNRMHAAAMGDTLGLSACILGLMIICGWNLTTVKMALVIIFLWNASPVASHMLAKLEVVTNENIDEHCKVYKNFEEYKKDMEEEKE